MRIDIPSSARCSACGRRGLLGSEQLIRGEEAFIDVCCFGCNGRWLVPVPSEPKHQLDVRMVLGNVIRFAAGDAPGLPASVFVSYSHRDKRWVRLLERALAPVMPDRELLLWSDTRIASGDIWRAQIAQAIASAKVAVLLVSPDYLASSFIRQHELWPILNAAVTSGLRVLWVPISASLVDATEIVEFHAAVDPSRPLDTLSTSQRNRAWVDIATAIRHAMYGS